MRTTLLAAAATLCACAAPGTLVLATSPGRADAVVDGVRAQVPAAKDDKTRVELLAAGSPGTVAERLRWALRRGVRRVGVDGAAGRPGDARIQPLMTELRLKGVWVGWFEFTDP